MVKKSTKKWKIIGFMLFVLVFCGLLFFLFSGDNFDVLKEIFNTNATKEQIQDSIGKLGFRAYLVVGIISMLQVILTFIPAEPLHVISGISFGLWKGMAVCLAGILLGNTIIYILYKIYGTKLTDFFAENVDFDFAVAKKSKKIALIVIILYCLPAIPYGIICFFAASMGMKYSKYILITGIGSIPSLVLDVGLGHITMSTSWTVSLIVLFAIIILLLLMFKYKKQLFAWLNNYVKASQEKQKNKVGNYNPFIFSIASNLVYSSVKRKVKIKFKDNTEKLNKPCIVLCNHGSFYDFIYAGKLIKKYRPHFIVARMYFHNKSLKFILDSTGAFPKSMFETDIENSKNCLKVINSKEVLAMMPEARLSTVGTYEGIHYSTFKFIQKMNVDVYTIKINGSYLAKPKWAKSIRNGALVEVELDHLFNAGETQQLSFDEIKNKIDNALNYNEWSWLNEHPEVTYKSKDMAEGLENILCICPKCKEKYTFTSRGDKLTCSHCGKEIVVDNRYCLNGVEFKNIAEWYNWQKGIFKEEINSTNEFKLESKVELRHLSKNGKSFTRPSGEGVCTFTKEGVKYIGTEDGAEIEKLFPLEKLYRVLFGAGEDFEIYEGQELYYFVPEEKRSAVAWYIVSEILKEKDGEKYE